MGIMPEFATAGQDNPSETGIIIVGKARCEINQRFSCPEWALRSAREPSHSRIRVSRSMPPQHWQAADATLPSPFPEGWYLVANRQAVLKSKLIQRLGWGRISLSGVTRKGASVSPSPFAHT